MEDKKMIVITAIIVTAIAAVGVMLIASHNTAPEKSYATHALSNTSTK